MLTKEEVQANQKRTAEAVGICLQMENNFKMMGYRLMTPEEFVKQTNLLAKMYLKQEKDATK